LAEEIFPIHSIIPAIKEALKNDILIVITSRTYAGRVIPEYGFEGGGKNLQDMGIIMGNDLKGTKMRLKLMILFGKYDETSKVREYLEKHQY
jgi:L-asparaginase